MIDISQWDVLKTVGLLRPGKFPVCGLAPRWCEGSLASFLSQAGAACSRAPARSPELTQYPLVSYRVNRLAAGTLQTTVTSDTAARLRPAGCKPLILWPSRVCGGLASGRDQYLLLCVRQVTSYLSQPASPCLWLRGKLLTRLLLGCYCCWLNDFIHFISCNQTLLNYNWMMVRRSFKG